MYMTQLIQNCTASCRRYTAGVCVLINDLMSESHHYFCMAYSSSLVSGARFSKVPKFDSGLRFSEEKLGKILGTFKNLAAVIWL